MTMETPQVENAIDERQTYVKFLRKGAESGSRNSTRRRMQEQLTMTPLFSWSTKEAALASSLGDFTQYALLGHVIPMSFDESEAGSDSAMGQLSQASQGLLLIDTKTETSGDGPHGIAIPTGQLPDDLPAVDIDPVMLHTDTPWSAFICGSQGSGKSHTMFVIFPCKGSKCKLILDRSCILEDCLMEDKNIGKLSEPLAGLVFHFDSMDSSLSEAAHLCSQGTPVHVLVPPSNFENLKRKYATIPGAEHNLTVGELYLQDAHFNTERIKRLMAFGDDSENAPLYLQVRLVSIRVVLHLHFV